MKRSPMKRGTTPLRTTKPMARGTSQLQAKAPMKKRAPKKRAGHDKATRDLCAGEQCYLRLVPCSGDDTVVPAHSNQQQHGKGMGLKASDEFTVPACAACHAELDQGAQFTKEQKRDAWDSAYARWLVERAKKQAQLVK